MSKQLKEPKKFLRPRAYIRFAKPSEAYSRTRLRIIYPDGKAEWANGEAGIYLTSTAFFEFYPCWHDNFLIGVLSVNNKSRMTAEAAVKAMKSYDAKIGYKTYYLGEF